MGAMCATHPRVMQGCGLGGGDGGGTYNAAARLNGAGAGLPWAIPELPSTSEVMRASLLLLRAV